MRWTLRVLSLSLVLMSSTVNVIGDVRKSSPFEPTGDSSPVEARLASPNQEEQQEEEKKGGIFSRLKRGRGPQLAEGNVLVLTTEMVDRPYAHVTAFPAVAMREWGGSSSSRPGGGLTDPGLTSVTRALESLQAIAKKHDADAVIGVKIDIEGPVGGEEGRAIAYGTLIRFLGDE